MRHATTFAPTFAIVPVKALGLAKRRLAPALPDAARRRLVLTMLEDVLTAVASVEGIARILVVTPDREVAALAEREGAAIVPEPNIEPGSQLNAAVEGGIAFALARGAAQALILPADVPLATPAELASLVASRGAKAGVTLAPSHDSNGTNALLPAPPNAITPCYGPGSYLQHMSQAMARHIDVHVMHLPGIARDIDEPADLVHLSAAGGERYAFLAPYLAGPRAPADHTAPVEDQ
jgi:2-phospho-L-lactate guanylyltransferase